MGLEVISLDGFADSPKSRAMLLLPKTTGPYLLKVASLELELNPVCWPAGTCDELNDRAHKLKGEWELFGQRLESTALCHVLGIRLRASKSREPAKDEQALSRMTRNIAQLFRSSEGVCLRDP